ncbi:MAG: TraB/GumN family protein, partial [Parvularculaceae bacterium]|nr:TraB/GumN family protein [Parvularculaceae bacterium]
MLKPRRAGVVEGCYMRILPLIVVGALFAGDAALAQESVAAPPPQETGASEEILVAEERAGPSFWRLHDGDTEIFVLPAVSFLPKNFRWNDRGVARVVAKSDSVLIGARVEANAGDKARLAGAMLRTMTVSRGRLYMPKGETLETHVGPELADAFARASARVEARRKAEPKDKAAGADATSAEEDEVAIDKEMADADPSRRRPFLQASALTDAAAKSAGLVAFRAVDKRVEKIADKAEIPVRALVEKRLVFADAKKFLTSMQNFSTETDRACVAEAVDFAYNRL